MAQQMPSLPIVHGHNGAYACWICLQEDTRGHMFRPCPCAEYVHRDCLEQWRFSSVNPTAHVKCPNCKFSYRFASSDDPEKFDLAERNYNRVAWLHVLKFWLVFVLVFFISSTVIGGITYACDPSKNIPTIFKYTIVRLFGHLPEGETHPQYRDDLRQYYRAKENPVWPQYVLFGFLLSCIWLSIAVLVNKDKFKVNNQRTLSQQSRLEFQTDSGRSPAGSQRRHRRSSGSSGCCSGGGGGHSSDCFCFCPSTSSSNDPCCDGCCKGCCSGGSGGGGSDCNCNCNCNGGGGNDDGAVIALLVVALVLAAVVGLVYLLVVGLAFSKDLLRCYMQKHHDREETRAGAVYIVDLEEPDKGLSESCGSGYDMI